MSFPPDPPPYRRFLDARRNRLPRSERVVAVAGEWAHREVIRLGAAIELALLGPDILRTATVADVLDRAEQISQIPTRVHTRLSADDPQALLSLVRLPEPSRWVIDAVDADLLLVADGVEYAGNLGTLIRTADACGAAALITCGRSARITHPAVFQASRAMVLQVPVLDYPDADVARRELAASGWRCVVTDPAAQVSYTHSELARGRLAVVVGSERTGVSPGWSCDEVETVSIPMLGRADSLNVAVSAAVVLAEARRQRG